MRRRIFLSLLFFSLPACPSRSPSDEVDDPEPGPDDPPGTGGFCEPGAVTRATTVAPELRAWILAAEEGSCHLDRRTSAGVSDGFPTTLDTFVAPGTKTCGDGGCWTALPAFARGWVEPRAPQAFTPPAEYPGVKWTGMVQAERHDDTGEIRATLTAMEYGSSALQRFERRFDAAGRLLEDRHSFDGSLWFTTVNTWEGDRLVASRFVDTVNGSGETLTAWRWTDDGRLAGVTVSHTDNGRTGAVDFAYEGARLISATRTVDGGVWARQTWRYADGRLVESGTEVDQSLLDAAYEVRGADDLEPLVTADTQLDWAMAVGAAPTSGSCAALPHAFSYGYPEVDGVYHLGWPVGDRPQSIDVDYGFGPAFDDAQDRWFGHDRVEGYRFALPFAATHLATTIAYDGDGRMVSETLTTEDGSVTATRTRSFEDGRVAVDTRALDAFGETLTTELRFRRDEDGAVVERSYTMNGVLVARHGWAYDGGEIASHTIAGHRIGDRLEEQHVVPKDLDTLGELPTPIVHERDFSADRRTIEIRRDGVLGETRTRDDAQHILSRRFGEGSLETFAYEASGELRSYVSDWEADGTPDSVLAWERADDARLLARDWSYGPGRSDRDVFTWICGE